MPKSELQNLEPNLASVPDTKYINLRDRALYEVKKKE